jgi:hypothetical protein
MSHLAMSMTAEPRHLSGKLRKGRPMKLYQKLEPRGVREQQPLWPRRQRRAAGTDPDRWRRPPEPWEAPFAIERYPGATVLEDWELTQNDPGGTARVLARYAVIRVVLLSEAGLLRGVKLRTERRIATEHLALLPAGDWERMALRRVNDLCAETPPRSLSSAILVAAEAAAKRGHTMGAFAFYRTAHHLAMEARAWDEASRAARGIARLARLDEAPYSTRLWEWRALVLERRAEREREQQCAHSQGDATGTDEGHDAQGGVKPDPHPPRAG